MDDEEQKRKRMQIILSYITLPFVLGIPPIIGWYIGFWIDKHAGTTPYVMYLMLILGMVAGVRECYRIVMKYKDEEM